MVGTLDYETVLVGLCTVLTAFVVAAIVCDKSFRGRTHEAEVFSPNGTCLVMGDGTPATV